MKIHPPTNSTFLSFKSDVKVILLLAMSWALGLSAWAQGPQSEAHTSHSSHSASPSTPTPISKKRLIDVKKETKQGGHKNKADRMPPDHMKERAQHMQQMRDKAHQQKQQQMHLPPRMSLPTSEGQIRFGQYFLNHHLIAAKAYYSQPENMGYCPPGLAKKGTGCLPPGQAKPWKLGETLPRQVIFYDVPRSVVVTLGAPPTGYKYVRVGSDILLIAIGTSMVIDALEDLVR